MRKTLLGAVSATAVFVSMPAVAQDTEAPAAQNPSQQAVSTDGDIVVTGVRQSLERAAEIKRNATQVVDSIVATDIGKLPDPTVAAALQRSEEHTPVLHTLMRLPYAVSFLQKK